MNSVTLIGRLTKEPDLRYTAGTQTAVARMTIAVDTGYGDKKRTDFPSIICFGNIAENCEKYLIKGSQVGITGRLQTGSYEKQDGTKVYTTDVIAEKVEFLSKASGEKNAEPKVEEPIPEGFAMIDEDIPF